MSSLSGHALQFLSLGVLGAKLGVWASTTHEEGIKFPDVKEYQPLLSTHSQPTSISLSLGICTYSKCQHPPTLSVPKRTENKNHSFLGEENIPRATRTKQKVTSQ